MKGKLGFGFISDLRSDILMIDETFGAGDREFKKKSKSRMNAMVNGDSNLNYVFAWIKFSCFYLRERPRD